MHYKAWLAGGKMKKTDSFQSHLQIQYISDQNPQRDIFRAQI